MSYRHRSSDKKGSVIATTTTTTTTKKVLKEEDLPPLSNPKQGTSLSSSSTKDTIWKRLLYANFEGFKVGFGMYIMIIATLMYQSKGTIDDLRPLLLIIQTYIFTYIIQARKENQDIRLLNYIFFTPLLLAFFMFIIYSFLRVFVVKEPVHLEHSTTIFIYFLAVTSAMLFYMCFIMYKIAKFLFLYVFCCCGVCGNQSLGACIQNEIRALSNEINMDEEERLDTSEFD